jgi:hypothetical protein
MKWISVKKRLPSENEIVKVKMRILFRTHKEQEAIYIKKYFVNEGKNITRWVSHWMPLPEPPKT